MVDEAPAVSAEQQSESTTHWSEGLSDENRQGPLYERFRDKPIDDFFKGYMNVEKFVGKSRMEKPSDDWNDEQWTEFYAQTGRPETPDQYELGELPDSLKPTWNQDFERGIIESAHKAGLSNRQMKMVREAYVSSVEQAQRERDLSMENARAIWQNEIKQEWGMEHQTGIAQARRALGLAGNPDELSQLLTEAGLYEHPAVLKYLRQVDTLTQAETPMISAQTQQSAQNEVNTLMQSPAYFDEGHPEHVAIREKVSNLFRIGAGG